MYYYNTGDDRRGKLFGAAAAVMYVGVLVSLMFLITFRFDVPLPGEGILINFGDTEFAGGEQDPAVSENIASKPQTTSTVQNEIEDHMTQDHEEAPVVEQRRPKPTRNQTPVVTPTPPKPKETTAQVTEQPQQVNKRALFQGRTQGSTATSEGTTTGEGNQGNPAGDPTGVHSGTGMGSSGSSFDLSGRSLIGSLPKPQYPGREEGKVVVQIVVDRNGSVTSASFRAAGSTTQSDALVKEALQAARKAKFDTSGSDVPQTGTITYIFRKN